MTRALRIIDTRLRNDIRWAVFGGVGVAVHHGRFYRQHKDIDLIVEDHEYPLRHLFYNDNFFVYWRNGRKRAWAILADQLVEFLFLTGIDEIDAPGHRKFRFREILFQRIHGLVLPVVDLGSLCCSKLRQFMAAKQDFARRATVDGWNKIVHAAQDLRIRDAMLRHSQNPFFSNIVTNTPDF